MTRSEPPSAGRGSARFATTRWSLVQAAGRASPDRSQALADLCADYWYPLYAYVRRRGHGVEEARDLTQSFFVHLLDKETLARADPARGRFRSFLLTSMKNFLAGEWRKETAQKRGGTAPLASLDFELAEKRYRSEPADRLTPEAVYERRWALGLLDRAVADLGREYHLAGKGELFQALQGAIGDRSESVDYPALAERLGQSEGSLRTAVSRLRSRWRQRLRQYVQETVVDASEVGAELRHLSAAVVGGGAASSAERPSRS